MDTPSTVMKKLLLAAALLATAPFGAVGLARAADPQQCVLYIDRKEGQLIHVRVPTCFDPKGNVIMNSINDEMRVSSRQKCEADVIEGVERVDPSTYLVRKYCKGGKSEYETPVFQLIDDGDGGTLQITNAENN
jgi:hypothetical protein